MYVYIYIYICTYIYIHIHWARAAGTMIVVGATPIEQAWGKHTVGFHNFNLRIFNSRVSNPDKLIVDVF